MTVDSASKARPARRPRLWKVLTLLPLAATALAAALWSAGGWLTDVEAVSYDAALRRFTRTRARSEHVVLIAIDDLSFREIRQNPTYALNFGNWPYSRALWARILEYLAAEGARAVVFDAVMDERPADVSGDLAFAEVAARVNTPLYLGFSTHPAGAQLPKVEAVNRLPGASDATKSAPASSSPVQPAEFEELPEEEADPPASPEELARALAFPVESQGVAIGLLADEGVPRHPNPPISSLVRAAAGLGLVEPEEDPDGKLRRTRFAYTDGKNTYLTLSAAVAADLLGAEAVFISPGQLRIGERAVRINREGDAALDFGNVVHERFPTASLFHVLDDSVRKEAGTARQLPPGLFAGKVVLLGGFAVGTNDIKATPFASRTPGVTKPAVELDALLGGGFIVRAGALSTYGFALLLAALSVTLLVTTRRTWLEVLWPAVAMVLCFLAQGLWLAQARVHLPALPAGLAGLFASLGAVAFNRLAATKDRTRMREMFGRYVERKLLDQMLEKDELPTLTGERREVTAFFSDIKGFSTFSEKFKDSPEALVKVLNVYLTRVSDVLLRHGGCLDKYIGDAVVCLFGAPLNMPDHPVAACRAALEVQTEIAALREQFRAQGLPDVYTRIGMNTATMFVGNFGSDHLFDYTAIGDGMNLAARLEGANKAYGSMIMIGPATYQAAKDHIEARELDWVQVAGKTEAVAVYELCALKGELSESKRRVLAQYEAGLSHFRAGRFSEAAAAFGAALEQDGSDGPSRAMLERVERALADPAEMTFDAVAKLEK